MVGHMFHHSNGLTLINDIASLDDKLFRIGLKHIEGIRFYLLQDSNNSPARQTSILHKFTDQVIAHILTQEFMNAMRISLFDSHCHSCLQLFLALDAIHGTLYYLDGYFRHTQMIIQFQHSTLYQIFRLEIYRVIGLLVNLAP